MEIVGSTRRLLMLPRFFNDYGNIRSVKRFHSNGEPSLELSYNKEGKELFTFYHSINETFNSQQDAL